MISCKIIQDLLILYASDECSDDSKHMVENHLETCMECQNAFETLKEPALTVKEKFLDVRTEDFNFRKGFKKIRTRWFLSLISVLLIFPLLGAGILVRNQAKGEGIAFTNLEELYATRSFLKAVQKGEYERAFSYIDVDRLYESVTGDPIEHIDDWDSKYIEVEIDGELWYVNSEVYQSDYEAYLKSGDADEFWAAMMIYNSEQRSTTAIPETRFENSAKIFAIHSGRSIRVVDKDTVVPDYGFDYTLLKAADGKMFYYPTYGGSYDENDPQVLINGSFIIPASVYETFMILIDQETEKVKETAEYYRKMGISSYTEILKKDFLSNMQNLRNQGITISSFSFSNLYRHTDSGEWQFDISLICEQGSSRSSSGGIIVFAKDRSLEISGGFYKTESDALILKVIEHLSVNDSPMLEN
ncbi:zf-HC2 domain-containing protein [Proteiniclasticum sp.]|uniref:zf-HC2 domain-containing protein n=1 Tax=Proteiniclasticum sp. TaxID=2053595 RepID=UPI0028962E20|nr:zf-HC2 domain-containing protein [Proteiniclasticum sp.]